MFSTGFTSSSVLFFSFYWWTSLPSCMVHDVISSKIGETLYHIFSQKNIPKWLTFLLASMTVTLTVLLLWIYLFLLMLIFVLQCLSLHWEILVMLLSQFPLTFYQIKKGCPISSNSFWLFSCWLWVFVTIWEMSHAHGWISWSLVLMLLLVNFVNGFRLELMYVSLIVNTRSSLTHLRGFHLVVLP